ncbi:MAG: hypothetical protein WCP31_00960 [Chloroflexales bacterium]
MNAGHRPHFHHAGDDLDDVVVGARGGAAGLASGCGAQEEQLALVAGGQPGGVERQDAAKEQGGAGAIGGPVGAEKDGRAGVVGSERSAYLAPAAIAERDEAEGADVGFGSDNLWRAAGGVGDEGLRLLHLVLTTISTIV